MPEPYNSLEPKPWQPVSSIPLAEAALCGNCQCIVIAKNGHCPVCESMAIVNLVALLERRGAVVNAVDTEPLPDATGEP
jgi:hypothetical protein